MEHWTFTWVRKRSQLSTLCFGPQIILLLFYISICHTLRSYSPEKNDVSQLFFLNSKTHFQWLNILIRVIIFLIDNIFFCWFFQALTQGFLFYNTLGLLWLLHSMLAHGINFSQIPAEFPLKYNCFFIWKKILRWLCSPEFSSYRNAGKKKKYSGQRDTWDANGIRGWLLFECLLY